MLKVLMSVRKVTQERNTVSPFTRTETVTKEKDGNMVSMSMQNEDQLSAGKDTKNLALEDVKYRQKDIDEAKAGNDEAGGGHYRSTLRSILDLSAGARVAPHGLCASTTMMRSILTQLGIGGMVFIASTPWRVGATSGRPT